MEMKTRLAVDKNRGKKENENCGRQKDKISEEGIRGEYQDTASKRRDEKT